MGDCLQTVCLQFKIAANKIFNAKNSNMKYLYGAEVFISLKKNP